MESSSHVCFRLPLWQPRQHPLSVDGFGIAETFTEGDSATENGASPLNSVLSSQRLAEQVARLSFSPSKAAMGSGGALQSSGSALLGSRSVVRRQGKLGFFAQQFDVV
jgi:hypothetical protein